MQMKFCLAKEQRIITELRKKEVCPLYTKDVISEAVFICMIKLWWMFERFSPIQTTLFILRYS